MRSESIAALIDAAASRKPASSGALEALRFFARKSASQLVRAVRSGVLRSRKSAAPECIGSLLRATGWNKLNATPNFLAAPPDRWASFTEPQITGGWVHHLEARSRLARCQAAFDAAWVSAGVEAPRLARVELVAAELSRIDMLIIGEDENEQRCCLCIEAKFGHALTDQLVGYERSLVRQHGIQEAERRALLIIAPKMRRDIAEQIARPGNAWGFLSWKQWLIAYDNALDANADDEAFRRFRSTVLHRAAQELEH